LSSPAPNRRLSFTAYYVASSAAAYTSRPAQPTTPRMLAPIFIKSKEEALPDVKDWYVRCQTKKRGSSVSVSLVFVSLNLVCFHVSHVGDDDVRAVCLGRRSAVIYPTTWSDTDIPTRHHRPLVSGVESWPCLFNTTSTSNTNPPPKIV
jgi:hypothetical protein